MKKNKLKKDSTFYESMGFETPFIIDFYDAESAKIFRESMKLNFGFKNECVGYDNQRNRPAIADIFYLNEEEITKEKVIQLFLETSDIQDIEGYILNDGQYITREEIKDVQKNPVLIEKQVVHSYSMPWLAVTDEKPPSMQGLADRLAAQLKIDDNVGSYHKFLMQKDNNDTRPFFYTQYIGFSDVLGKHMCMLSCYKDRLNLDNQSIYNFFRSNKNLRIDWLRNVLENSKKEKLDAEAFSILEERYQIKASNTSKKKVKLL